MLRRIPSGDSAIVSCGGDERPSFDRDRWFFLREACEAKRSQVQRKRGNHVNWLRVFGQEPPSVAVRSFHADIFEIEAKTERVLQLKAKKRAYSGLAAERWRMGPGDSNLLT